jgi:hypothetical protein
MAATDWLDSAAKISLSTLEGCLVMESKSRPTHQLIRMKKRCMPSVMRTISEN